MSIDVARKKNLSRQGEICPAHACSLAPSRAISRSLPFSQSHFLIRTLPAPLPLSRGVLRCLALSRSLSRSLEFSRAFSCSLVLGTGHISGSRALACNGCDYPIEPVWWVHLQFGLFSVPTSCPQLVHQRLW